MGITLSIGKIKEQSTDQLTLDSMGSQASIQESGMHVLITGGAGFIGSHLAQFHLCRGDTVEIVDDLSSGSTENLAACAPAPRLSFECVNLFNWQGLDQAVFRANRIYHMAAIVGTFRVLWESVDVIARDIQSTERVLEAAVKGGRHPQVILPSSALVYGNATYDQMHEDAPLLVGAHPPSSSYAISKFIIETMGRSYHQEHGLPVVIARLFNAVGGHQCALYGSVLPRFVQQALSASPITVFGNGLQTRSFCDVRDTVAMLQALADCEQAYGKPVNVGNDYEMTIVDLAARVKSITGSSSPIEFISHQEAYGKPVDEISTRRPILDRVRRLTGYQPRWTIDDSIMALCDHYRAPPRHSACIVSADPHWINNEKSNAALSPNHAPHQNHEEAFI